MSQMAAFSTLEQVTNLAVSNEELNGMISTNQSLALVGHQVSYLKEDGTKVEGTVESVDFGEEGSSLTIGGVSGISPGQVSQVK